MLLLEVAASGVAKRLTLRGLLEQRRQGAREVPGTGVPGQQPGLAPVLETARDSLEGHDGPIPGRVFASPHASSLQATRSPGQPVTS